MIDLVKKYSANRKTIKWNIDLYNLKGPFSAWVQAKVDCWHVVEQNRN